VSETTLYESTDASAAAMALKAGILLEAARRAR